MRNDGHQVLAHAARGFGPLARHALGFERPRLLLVQLLALGDVLGGPDEAHRLPVLIEERAPRGPHPALGPIRSPDGAIFDVEDTAGPQLERSSHGLVSSIPIVGVQAAQKRRIVHLRIGAQPEHGLAALGPLELPGLRMKIPGAQRGRFYRELQALLALPEGVFRLEDAQRLANAGRHSLGGEVCLRDIVDGSGFHQLDRRVLVPLTRQHDERRAYPLRARLLDQPQPVAARHVEVHERAVNLPGAQDFEPSGGFRGLQHFGLHPPCAQRSADAPAIDLVVIYEQQGQAVEHLRGVRHGSSTSVQYLLRAAIKSTKLGKVTGLSR